MCGAQAQVMTAAYLQLWTRNHALTRAEIENALWTTRTLVKTSLMRQTLHLIPTDEFPTYIAALNPCRVAQALSVMARCGISPEEGHAITPMIMEALSAGPLRRPDIAAAVRPKVSKRVRFWMENSWSMIRIPVAEGNICYGRGEGNEIVFIRTDQWLPKALRKSIPVQEAQCELLRKYLRAYGPATITDFAHWAGLSMAEVKKLPALLETELAEIPDAKKGTMLLREDVAVLEESSREEKSVRLLPLFDPYLLAHREKDHLLSTQHYKRVYRNQGWISPVVLVDGVIAAVDFAEHLCVERRFLRHRPEAVCDEDAPQLSQTNSRRSPRPFSAFSAIKCFRRLRSSKQKALTAEGAEKTRRICFCRKGI